MRTTQKVLGNRYVLREQFFVMHHHSRLNSLIDFPPAPSLQFSGQRKEEKNRYYSELVPQTNESKARGWGSAFLGC